jgi:ABC-type transporter Mla subunit MlaD
MSELVLLEGISRLHKTMDKVLDDSPSSLTPATLRSLTQPLHTCKHQLAQLGAPTERLQQVYQLAEQACDSYIEAATSFDTAASSQIPIAGTHAARKIDEAINSGFAALGRGSGLFADAEVKGFEIKQAAG